MAEENPSLRAGAERLVRAQKGSRELVATQLLRNMLLRAQGQAPGAVGYQPPTAEEAATFNEPLLKAHTELTQALNDRAAGRDTILEKKLEMARHMLNYAIGHLKTKMTQATQMEKAKLQQRVKVAEETVKTMDTAIERLVPGMKKGGAKFDPDKVVADFVDRVSQPGVHAMPLLHKTLMKGKTPQEVDEIAIRLQAMEDIPHLKSAVADLDPWVVPKAVQHAKDLRAEGALTPEDLADMPLDEESAKELAKFLSPAGRRSHWDSVNEQIDGAFAATGGQIHPMIAQMSQALSGDASVTTIPEALSAFGGDPKQQAAADKAFADETKLEKAALMDKMLDPNAPGPVKQAKIDLISNPAFLQKQRELGIMNTKAMLKALARGYRQEERQERQQSMANLEKISANPSMIFNPALKTIESARESLAATARSKPSSSAPAAEMLSNNLEDVNEKTGVT